MPEQKGRLQGAGGDEASARAAAQAQASAKEQEAAAARVHAQQQELLAMQAQPGAEFGTAAASQAAGLAHQARVAEIVAAATAKGIDCAEAGLEHKTPEELAEWAKQRCLESACW